MLYVLCGVSSAGKTTLLKGVLKRDPSLGQLITYTTRLPRQGEVNHADYHFVSASHFHAAVQAGQLVCPICHRGQWYATALDSLRACQSHDMIAVLRPDKIGELEQYTPLIGMYIVGPSLDQPPTEDDQIIVAHQHLCRYRVVNERGSLDQAVDEIVRLLQTHTGGVQCK